MTKKKIVKWLLLTTFAVVLLMAIAGLLAPNVLRCYFVPWSRLDRIAPGVYVDPVMPTAGREQFRSAFYDAQGRVAELFGEYSASPVIIAGHTMEIMEVYGGNTYNRAGRTISSGVKTFLILGPVGYRDISILSHELVHAEFFNRIGFRNRDQIPNWFEEGLAVQVDDRVSLEQWRISTQDGKYAPDLAQIGVIRHDDWLGYATAKNEVHRWLEIVGQDGLLELIEDLRAGGEFYQAYPGIEAEGTQTQKGY